MKIHPPSRKVRKSEYVAQWSDFVKRFKIVFKKRRFCETFGALPKSGKTSPVITEYFSEIFPKNGRCP